MENRREWVVADHACCRQNIVSVPLHTAADGETLAYIINHCELETVIVSGASVGAACVPLPLFVCHPMIAAAAAVAGWARGECLSANSSPTSLFPPPPTRKHAGGEPCSDFGGLPADFANHCGVQRGARGNRGLADGLGR